MKAKKTAQQRCEGWRRKGGAFTFGPVKWIRCHKPGIVMLTFHTNAGIVKTLPACKECWLECIDTGVNIKNTEPIK